jgi:hypothetical protein
MFIEVLGAEPGTTVEVAPGQKIVPLPVDAARRVALVELIPAGDGTFRQIARVCPAMWTVSRDGLKKLQITISEMTMRRLIGAGFVQGCLVSPYIMQFDVYSYWAHCEAVRADPEFWTQKQPGHAFTNLARYRHQL